MFEYNSRTGVMTENGATLPDGDKCYSGHGPDKNNPEMESMSGEGPTPRGLYKFGPGYDDPGGLGKLVMHLDPLPGTNVFGRSLFRVHGDSAEHPGEASHGCIVAPHTLRAYMNAARDRVLKVYA